MSIEQGPKHSPPTSENAEPTYSEDVSETVRRVMEDFQREQGEPTPETQAKIAMVKKEAARLSRFKGAVVYASLFLSLSAIALQRAGAQEAVPSKPKATTEMRATEKSPEEILKALSEVVDSIRKNREALEEAQQKGSGTTKQGAPVKKELLPSEQVKQMSEQLGSEYDGHNYLKAYSAVYHANDPKKRALADEQLKLMADSIIRAESELAYAQQKSGGWPEYAKIIGEEADLKLYEQKLEFMQQAMQGKELSAAEKEALVKKAMDIARAARVEARRRNIALAKKIKQGRDPQAIVAKSDEYLKLQVRMEKMQEMFQKLQGASKIKSGK